MGWSLQKLNDVCVVERGSSPRPIKSFLTDNSDGVNWIKIGDTKNVNKYIYETAQKITPEGALKSRKVEIGDFILSNSMSFGRPYIMKTSGYIHDGWFVLRLKDSVDSEYLYHLLTSNYVQDQFTDLAAGAIVKNISGDLVKKTLLPIPPLEEQKRIVAILDEAFAGIDKAIKNTEKNLANAKELFESYLNNIFTQKGGGWVESTLKEISIDFGRGKSKHRPRNDPKLYGGEYPFIQTGDVRNSSHFIKNHSQSYSEMGLAQSKLWPKGTLCITIAANIAETGVLAFDSCFPDSIIGLVVDDKKYSISFIEYCLQFTKVKLQAAGKGSAQDNINLATFEDWKFSFPPYTEQLKIVERLKTFDEQSKNLDVIYNQKLTTLKELKQSLLQKAFAGELTSDLRDVA